MRSSTGFAAAILAVLAGALLIAAVAAPFVKAALEAAPSSGFVADLLRTDPRTGSYDFGRVYRRMAMLAALALLLALRRSLGPVRLLGVDRGQRRASRLAAGFGAGLLTWLLFVALLVALDRRTAALGLPADWTRQLPAALLAALLVAAIEETVLRGYLLGGLRRHWPTAAAVLASSALYAILHFMRARATVSPGWDPWVGLRVLGRHLAAAARPEVLPGFVGLLLLGVVLGCAYLWTRSLPFVIGLHAGWVFLIMTEEFYLLEKTGTRGLYAEGGVLAGPLGWAFLGALIVALWLVTRRLRSPAA